MKKVLCAVALCVVLVVLLGEVHVTTAVSCDAMQLSPCADAIMLSRQPSAACCEKLREQLPCLCEYLKNPALRPYVDSPNAQKFPDLTVIHRNPEYQIGRAQRLDLR
ncbi:hypothetical protein RJ640_011000 [Escallonia rubra]|uniref:Bifunctional inhibitor/plant lipid transfer protein/seed storage helical domain-containing protein n=1 Tax=Escallonia rubra TaxID=112253 RepID=A0AA88UJ05_9ASTE|nr:hypothetical protein RJ640_011000 [Escallonia rubra]